jgi:hypothetical protein
MERMACNSSRWKAVNQSKDSRIKRRRRNQEQWDELGMWDEWR